MTEIREVNTADEGEDLIPMEALPTDKAALGQTPEQTPPAEEPEKEDEVPKPEDAPAAESSPAAPVEKPEVHSQQPTPVEGETPREKALRLETQRLRGLLRRDNIKELAEGAGAPAEETDEYEILKEQGYTDEQIKAMETAVDLIASKKGYVRADRNYAQTVQDTVDLFTESHPEYKPASDADDIRWNLFQSYLKDGTYNLSGKTPKQLTAIFEKVDADVRKELGETVVKTNPRAIAAQQHKVNVVSHSGGTKPTIAARPAMNPKEAGGIKLVGFDEDDFKE